jgi:hypothetical protein
MYHFSDYGNNSIAREREREQVVVVDNKEGGGAIGGLCDSLPPHRVIPETT